ncbi:hypothetical protein Nm8I071_36730 [Nonomuraea sp. TT08I-71]|nr:hypothetical protein Nm8I071_36730 [Nonomuraea sp. TT08I-71]
MISERFRRLARQLAVHLRTSIAAMHRRRTRLCTAARTPTSREAGKPVQGTVDALNRVLMRIFGDLDLSASGHGVGVPVEVAANLRPVGGVVDLTGEADQRFGLDRRRHLRRPSQ